VFYEGPPTANGRPGIHHVFARTVKDLFCRHRAMLGTMCRARRAGTRTACRWRSRSRRRSASAGKQDIERIGVAEFNRRCRESVWTYKGDWEAVSERMGYWLDYADPYITYTTSTWRACGGR
jgi:isoleucyl-tRNA synthetase